MPRCRPFTTRALAEAQAIAPLPQWRGAAGRVLAGRLANNLGAPRLGRILHRLAHREDPADPEALYYNTYAILERRGPLAALELMERYGDLPEAPPETQADWLSLRARLMFDFRDFQEATRLLDRAENLATKAWILVERAALLERQDRYAESLATARRALELHPWHRPAVQAAAHLLQLIDRDDEALALLKTATTHTESVTVTLQLASLQTELRLYEDARQSFERAVELAPLADKIWTKWLAAQRSDAAYYCGDYQKAAELAEQADNAFYKAVARKLRETCGRGKRVVLPVGFIRQHHMTCAPATLAAIGRFWLMPTDHLSVAEEICYDGTPAHSERRWAEQHGWTAIEFRTDWESTVALIDAGIPFTFTTVEPSNAHLQSVIGYDELRGTLIIRDPYFRHFGEFVAEASTQRWRSTGPRGMLMAPKDRAPQLLDGRRLPEQSLYDGLHALQTALDRHDRPAAAGALAQMEREDASHRLTWWGRRAIAYYDSDTPGMLAAYEKLLELFPDDATLKLGKLSCLRVLARRDQRLALLKEICDAKGADPLFWEQYAQELREDARLASESERLLRRALRFRRYQASTYYALAGVLWDRRQFDKSRQLYRIAASLDDKDERFARSYFIASRHARESEQVLAILRDRFARSGRRSGRPARLLFWALEQLDRELEGFEVLDEAIRIRPDDGELMLLAADALARHGRFDAAQQRLEASQSHCSTSAWNRTAADIALYRGDSQRALALWRQVIEAEPLAMDAHGRIARLLSEADSPAAAVAHLDAACERFPHNYPLLQLRAEWVHHEAPERAEQTLRQLIELYPADAWARREIVSVLLTSQKNQEALAEADEAVRLEPTRAASHYFRGAALERRGRWGEAREAYRESVRMSVDYDYSIRSLVASCHTLAQRREALAFVKAELEKQTIFGDGLLAWRGEASRALEAEEVLALLREALGVRPDLWHAWSAVTGQLHSMGRLDEARANALEATRRFPLLPRVWLDLARVERGRGDRPAELAALTKTLEISPAWAEAIRILSEAHERAGDFQQSRAVLEQGIARAPGDAYMHGMLADILWKLDDRDGALKHVERAVQLDPGYEWAWHSLSGWAARLKQPDLAVRMARELTQKRGGESRSWLVLARMLDKPADQAERLVAIDRAIALSPRNADAHDFRAVTLCEAGKHQEALLACQPGAWGENVPIELRGRSAWVEAQRKNYAAAIVAMRKALEEAPAYYWGRSELCSWYRITNDNANYLEAARQMVQRWPLDAKSLGFLADAKLRTGDREGARADLRQALARKPDYGFASRTLFEMELEDKRLEAAEELARLTRHFESKPATAIRSIKLKCARGKREDAAAELRELCTDPATPDWAVDEAVEELVRQKWQFTIEQALGQAVDLGNVKPVVARRLVERLGKAGQWRQCRRRLKQLVQQPEAYREAVHEYLCAAAHKRKMLLVRLFILSHRRQIRAETHMWGAAGYALQMIHDHGAVIRLMSDWQSRKDVRAWMLANLTGAYRARGQYAIAHTVSEHAFKLNDDHSRAHGIHALWLAADALFAANCKQARSYLSEVGMAEQHKSYHFVRHMIDAALAVCGTDKPDWNAGREKVIAAERVYPGFRREQELRRLYRKCLRKMSGSLRLGGRLWCWGRMIGS
ncbi:MAG TPA: tetratricopeptide repeat protein [Tepidisphaeraceae bacterium]|nr:tetratricopeptide repeat protein [Tepidisphaeraceae bacterium]